MNRISRTVFFILFLGFPNHNAFADYYFSMVGLALKSTDIVLAQEGECLNIKNDKQGLCDASYEQTFTVIEVFKGSLKPKQKIAVSRPCNERRFYDDPASAPPIPKSKALLFLNKEKLTVPSPWVYKPIKKGVDCDKPRRRKPAKGILFHEVFSGTKLIVDGEAFAWKNRGFGRMEPENIEVKESERYTAELLLKDLKIAIEKSRALTEADYVYKWSSLLGPEKFRGVYCMDFPVDSCTAVPSRVPWLPEEWLPFPLPPPTVGHDR